MKLRSSCPLVLVFTAILFAVRMTAQPCQPDAPVKPTSVVFGSRQGSATLIGFSEFTTPSNPPRKFRRMVTEGTLFRGTWDLDASSSCDYPSVPFSWEVGETDDRPNGYPYGPITWSASLTPVSTDAAGRILYRARTQVSDSGLWIRIRVDLGNSAEVLFYNGEEKYIDPFSHTPPFNGVAECPGVSAWGSGLNNGSKLFVPKSFSQTQDVWNREQEYSGTDPSGSTWVVNTDASVRYSGRSFTLGDPQWLTPGGLPNSSDYAGLIDEVLSPTSRRRTGSNTCVTGPDAHRRRMSGASVETLSVEDTEDDAQRRAAAESGTSSVAYRTSRGSGFTFSFSEVTYTARFAQACDGNHNLYVVYTEQPHGGTGVASPEKRQFLQKLDLRAGEKVVTGTVRVGSGPFTQLDTDYTILRFELERLCQETEPGSSGVALGSARFWMNLGLTSRGESAGQLRLETDALSTAVYTPAALVLTAPPSETVVQAVKNADGVLRQVRSPQTLADIVQLDAAAFEVRFHDFAQIGAADPSTGEFAVSGTPFVTYKIENPDAAQGLNVRLRITETRGSDSRTNEFSHSNATSTWSLSAGGGLRTETEVQTVVNGDRVRTRTVRDNANQIVTKFARTYHTFSWGEELIREILDPDGAALTSTCEYYDSVPSSDPNYRRLKQRTERDGSWERTSYDASGRVVKTIRPFLEANPATADEALCRVTLNSHDTIADADGDGQPEVRTTTIERTLGQETARRYEIDWSNAVTLGGDVCRRRTHVLCTEAGAPWDAAANLVTETLRYAAGAFADRPRRVVNPDGTAVLTTRAFDAGGVLITTVKAGQPNAARDDIVDGRLTVTTSDARGQVTGEQVLDVASGLVLDRSITAQSDALGRPTRIEFDDGTFVVRTYACCGLASERDRSGITTTHTYDALGRRITSSRLGLTTRTSYDAEGRVLSVVRVGSDATEMIQEANGYDSAGRLSAQRDALGRLTALAESFDAATGRTTRTTTNPDGGTSIEVFARDGSRTSVGGTSVASRAYEYGVDATGIFTKTIAVGSDANGLPTATEWVKVYTDFAGRIVQMVFADGATARTFYNAAGQLVREVDPDGVTSLYGYNARGEREIVAIDLDGNNAIDFAGTDRITRTVATVATRTANANNYVVQRTTTQVWETDSADTPTTVSVAEQTTNGFRSWQTKTGLTTSSVTVPDGSGGLTISTTAPDGVKTIRVYRGDRLSSHTVKTASDVQLAATTYAYDAHGRMLSATDARCGVTTFTYNAADQLVSVTTPDPDPTLTGPGYDPQTTSYTYDSGGRVQSVTHPDGGIVHTTYWPAGAVRRTWGARTYPAEYTYDSQGRLKTLTTWQNFAGDTGRAVTTWNYHPHRGWILHQHNADNSGPAYTYKPSGRLLTRTWARTPIITATYSYNAAGDPVTTAYSDSTPAVNVTYDRVGRPKTIADASGLRDFAYHGSGQLQGETYSAGPLNGLAVSRTFDSLHRPAGLATPAATYAYDEASRLATVTAGQSTVAYAYYANSSLVSTVTFKQAGVDRLVTAKTYDHLNRLASINNTLNAPALALNYRYAYNAANQRTRATREDNTYWSFEYDALGQIVLGRKFLADQTAALGLDYAWTFDDIGNRQTATTNGAVATYMPNALNQYTQRTVPGVIDVRGAATASATVTVAVNDGPPQATNRQGGTFFKQLTVDNSTAAQNPTLRFTGVQNLAGPQGEDAVAEITKTTFIAKTPETFGHDADGNLTDDARWHFTWDGENRLISAETPAGIVTPNGPIAATERRRLEFTYDCQGRRIAKKVFTWSGGTWTLASHTHFLYDGWNLLAELNALAGNSIIRSYLWGLDLSGSTQGAGGVGGLLGVTDAATGVTHFAAYDGNGNVAGLARATDGALTAQYEYNAFGETVAIEGTYAAQNPFRFSTKHTDSETGHLYYGHRSYAPSLGRWLNRDPLGEEGGLNLYGFVENAPTTWADPFGLALYAFDGTNNDGDRDRWDNPEAENGPTNVKILYDIYSGNRFYAHGVGTRDGVRNLAGLAGGLGGKAREESALRAVDEFLKGGDTIADIIGFSRGAAEARDFANQLRQKYPCIRIRWIGLFDTVASFGLGGNGTDIGYRFGIPSGTESVFHLTAGGERRHFFPLMSISAGADRPNPNRNYREIRIPGAAHSDIGGGYRDDRGLANFSLVAMWRDGRSRDVPFGSVPRMYLNFDGKPHDSRWKNDKIVELLRGGPRQRKVFYSP